MAKHIHRLYLIILKHIITILTARNSGYYIIEINNVSRVRKNQYPAENGQCYSELFFGKMFAFYQILLCGSVCSPRYMQKKLQDVTNPEPQHQMLLLLTNQHSIRCPVVCLIPISNHICSVVQIWSFISTETQAHAVR